MTDLPEPEPRAFFGRRLEPQASVLHGAGQDPDTFQRYTDLMAERHTRPVMAMLYASPKGLAQRVRAAASDYAALGKSSPPGFLQLGLSMTRDGQPEKHYEDRVAEGEFDGELREGFAALKECGLPAYVRIGYEFNGPWNGYEAETYIPAFRRVAGLLRESGAPAATVWCAEAGKLENFMDFYPGDEWVDWWSIDIFATDHFQMAVPFLEAAHEHRRPVMIGESTPRRVGVEDGPESWERWFAPYFRLIRSWPGVKAFCYINWNWAATENWPDWGNARIEENPFVLSAFKEEIRHPVYCHLDTPREAL